MFCTLLPATGIRARAFPAVNSLGFANRPLMERIHGLDIFQFLSPPRRGAYLRIFEPHLGHSPSSDASADVDKNQYPAALHAVRPKLRRGGLLITDNTIWSGKAARPAPEEDKDTKGVQEFNRMVYASKELYPVLIPLRDGLTICRKSGTGTTKQSSGASNMPYRSGRTLGYR